MSKMWVRPSMHEVSSHSTHHVDACICVAFLIIGSLDALELSPCCMFLTTVVCVTNRVFVRCSIEILWVTLSKPWNLNFYVLCTQWSGWATHLISKVCKLRVRIWELIHRRRPEFIEVNWSRSQWWIHRHLSHRRHEHNGHFSRRESWKLTAFIYWGQAEATRSKTVVGFNSI